MMNNKKEFLNFIEHASVLRKGVYVGIYNSENKRVTTNVVRFDRVKEYVKTFDVMYDDNFCNKAFPKFKVFAIKYEDGKEYTLDDLKTLKPKAEKSVKEKKEEDDGEI